MCLLKRTTCSTQVDSQSIATMWRFQWFAEAFSADASAAVKVTVASPQVPLKTAEPKTSDS